MNDVKINMKVPKTINLDENTLSKIERYQKEHCLSLSATIRLAVNEFFLKQEVLDG